MVYLYEAVLRGFGDFYYIVVNDNMICIKSVKQYCKKYWLIENYESAIADESKWDCHHRLESKYSRKELIKLGLYYNRPPIELVFLTRDEHNKLHFVGKKLSDEHKKKIGDYFRGKPITEERKRKISESHKGKKLSAETRRKISENNKRARLGKHHTEEAKRKISENHAMRGKFGAENPYSIKIVQIFNDGSHKIWDSLADAARELKINSSQISNTINGRQATCKGFRFMYYDDWVKLRKSKHSIADISPLF